MEPFGKETVLLDGLRVVGEVEKLSLLLCEVISPLSSGVTLVGHARFSRSRKPVLGPKWRISVRRVEQEERAFCRTTLD